MKIVSAQDRLHRANAALVRISLMLQAHHAAHHEGDAVKLDALRSDIEHVVNFYLDWEELNERDDQR